MSEPDHRCRICHHPAWYVDCCEHCMYAPLWTLIARHPFRSITTGWLYLLGIIK